MKKYIAVLAAVAVFGATVILLIQGGNEDKPEAEGVSASSSYSENDKTQSEETDSDGGEADKTEAVSENKTEEKTSETEKTQVTSSQQITSKSAQSMSFSGTLMQVQGNTLIVSPDSGTSEALCSDKISVPFSGTVNVAAGSKVKIVDEDGKEVRADDIKNFRNVRITYDGVIAETYPAQITGAQKIELSEREYCNVYFYCNNSLITVRRVKTGGILESADMPNAGAYAPDGSHFEAWSDGKSDVKVLTNIRDSVVLTARIRKD